MSPAVSTLVAVVAFLLLAGAVASAFLPGAPTGAVSLAGVLVYWWGSGYTEPGTVLLVALVGICVLAVAADWFSGVVAAKVGGASTTTTVAAGLVGLALLFFTGPVGMLAGSAAVVFLLEFRKHRDAKTGATAAGAFVLGFFASAVIQAFLAFWVLVAMGWVALF